MSDTNLDNATGRVKGRETRRKGFSLTEFYVVLVGVQILVLGLWVLGNPLNYTNSFATISPVPLAGHDCEDKGITRYDPDDESSYARRIYSCVPEGADRQPLQGSDRGSAIFFLLLSLAVVIFNIFMITYYRRDLATVPAIEGQGAGQAPKARGRSRFAVAAACVGLFSLLWIFILVSDIFMFLERS